MPQQQADADDDAEEREEYAWVGQAPTTRIKGTPTDIIYAGRLDENTAQNDTSFGIVLEDAEVVNGSLWVNQEKPEDATTAEGVEDDEPRPTDYRVVDEDDRNTTIANGALVTEEGGPNTYEESDSIAEDTVIVWYNGMAGERLARVLDFNGLPFARWTSDGYLVKGLLQPAIGWRDASSDERRTMKDNGKAPRIARVPVLRSKVEYERDDDGDITDATLLDEADGDELLIDISRFQGGRAYEAHVFDADAFADEQGSVDADLPRNDSGYVEDIESELEWQYSPAADTVLEQAGYAMRMYTGEGFQNQPEGWQPQSTSEVTEFGVSSDSGGSEGDDAEPEGLTAKQEQFVNEIVDDLKGTGMTPEERFNGGIEGLVGKYEDDFDRVPDLETIREEIWTRVAHLDEDLLDE